MSPTSASSPIHERLVAPSILSADFARLGSRVDEVLAVGARVIHVDVMDGRFVPPISFGAVVLGGIADRVHGAGGILDAHLMIEHPERQIGEIARAGAESITVHAEATPHLHYVLATIREAGCTHGAALEVDGGIHEDTIASAARPGANLFVTGSGVFASADPASAYLATAAALEDRPDDGGRIKVAAATKPTHGPR